MARSSSPTQSGFNSSRARQQPPLQGNSSLYYRDGSKTGARIDGSVRAERLMGQRNEGPIPQRGRAAPMPSRADNILKARNDGTFDMKRSEYNAANKGSYMDESGTIGPKAPLPTGNPSNERVPVPAAPPPAGAMNQSRADFVGPTQPRKPATFEGKSRAEFFGAAQQRQGVGNAYSNEALAQSKPAAPASTRMNTGIAGVDAAGPGPANKAPAATTAFKPAPLPGPAPAGTKEPPSPLTSSRAVAATTPKPAPTAAPAAAAPTQSMFARAGSGVSMALKQGSQVLTDAKRQADEAAAARRPGYVKVGSAIGTGAKAAAQGLNEGIPAMASAAANKAEQFAKSTASRASQAVAPARNWLLGSTQKSAAELNYERMTTPPPVKSGYVPTYTGGATPPVPTAAQPKKKQLATR